MATCLSDLGDELLTHVLSFAAARDVESITVASPVVACDVVPWFSTIWKNIFRRRWEALNFPLDGVAQGDALLQINENLDTLFPRSMQNIFVCGKLVSYLSSGKLTLSWLVDSLQFVHGKSQIPIASPRHHPRAFLCRYKRYANGSGIHRCIPSVCKMFYCSRD